MKHFLLLFLLLIAFPALCQQNVKYEIFKTVGKVSYASGNQPLKKGDAVKPIDRIVIDKDSKVGILDRDLRNVYYSSVTGTHSVAAIIRDAKRKADNAVAAVNSEAFGQSSDASQRPNVMGVSYRGTDTHDTGAQAICNAILDIPSANPDNKISLSASEKDDAFCFSLTNDSDSLLYVNVIAMRPKATPQLCLNVGSTDNQPFIAIAPHSSLTMSEFPFVADASADYYMFASFRPFDTQMLSLLLVSGRRFEDVENATIIVSPKFTFTHE